jgi:hypothetical protein
MVKRKSKDIIYIRSGRRDSKLKKDEVSLIYWTTGKKVTMKGANIFMKGIKRVK